MMIPFQDRTEAGQLLADRLSDYAERSDVLVLALPRGGVPVAFEVSRALGAPLDVFVVRKLSVPGREDLAIGAIASGGICLLNEDVVQSFDIPQKVVDAVAARELGDLRRRERAYRGDRPMQAVRGRTVILVDDGMATGSTMRAAVAAVRRLGPARVVVAVPTAAPSVCDEFERIADECVCEITPDPFWGVGQWYEDFSQTTVLEVRELLELASRPHAVTMACEEILGR